MGLAPNESRTVGQCELGSWFFFSSRRRHTRWTGDWSSDVCSSDLDDYQEHVRVRRVDPQLLIVVAAGSPADRRPGDAAVFRPPEHRRAAVDDGGVLRVRSEERRVGKECRSRWSMVHQKKEERRTRY